MEKKSLNVFIIHISLVEVSQKEPEFKIYHNTPFVASVSKIE